MGANIDTLLDKVEQVVEVIANILLKQREHKIQIDANKDLLNNNEKLEEKRNESLEKDIKLVDTKIEVYDKSAKSSNNRVWAILFLIIIPMFAGMWGYMFNMKDKMHEMNVNLKVMQATQHNTNQQQPHLNLKCRRTH